VIGKNFRRLSWRALCTAIGSLQRHTTQRSDNSAVRSRPTPSDILDHRPPSVLIVCRQHSLSQPARQAVFEIPRMFKIPIIQRLSYALQSFDFHSLFMVYITDVINPSYSSQDAVEDWHHLTIYWLCQGVKILYSLLSHPNCFVSLVWDTCT